MTSKIHLPWLYQYFAYAHVCMCRSAQAYVLFLSLSYSTKIYNISFVKSKVFVASADSFYTGQTAYQSFCTIYLGTFRGCVCIQVCLAVEKKFIT